MRSVALRSRIEQELADALDGAARTGKAGRKGVKITRSDIVRVALWEYVRRHGLLVETETKDAQAVA